MDKRTAEEMKLSELAERAGVPARTIRLYISRGLLPGPLRSGRKAAYGPHHLAILKRIKELQHKGLTLAEIRHALGKEVGREDLPPPTGWWSYAVGPDVIVLVRGDGSPWRLRQVRNAILLMTEYLKTEHEEGNGDGYDG